MAVWLRYDFHPFSSMFQTGWWWLEHLIFFHLLGMSSSHLTNSYSSASRWLAPGDRFQRISGQVWFLLYANGRSPALGLPAEAGHGWAGNTWTDWVQLKFTVGDVLYIYFYNYVCFNIHIYIYTCVYCIYIYMMLILTLYTRPGISLQSESLVVFVYSKLPVNHWF